MHWLSLSGIATLAFCSVSSLAIEARAQSAGQPEGTLANPLEAQSFERLSATRDRPLFSPSRRPVPPPPPPAEHVATAPPPPPPPNVRLFGIVLDGDGARAIVRSGTDKVDRVQIGDDIGGWTVSQIEGRYLVLSHDGRFAKFTLFSDEDGNKPPANPDEPGDTAANKLIDQSSQRAAPHTAEPRAAGPQAAEPKSRRHRRPH